MGETKRTRDLTLAQFAAACERGGFRPEGFFGYYILPVPGQVAVSILNAGPTRREQLAYLHAEQRRWEQRSGKA